MSSTARGGVREASDYYWTPKAPIAQFLEALLEVEPNALVGKALDPCAGGDDRVDMSYPSVLHVFGMQLHNIVTMDIREDSRAEIKGNFLDAGWADAPFNLVISNPPFALAQQFIEHSLNYTREGGLVIMLLRLNYFGSQKRFPFWKANMAKHTFVHSKRISFGNTTGTDSIEYMHCVWQKGYHPEHTQLRII